MIRASRAARIRGLGGPVLNLSPTSTTCPPGYHWVADGPIQGVRRMGAIAACVKNPVIALHLGPAPAPAAPPPRKVIPLRLGPTPAPASSPAAAPVSVPAPATASAPDLAPEPTPAAPTCGPCWPWWWLLVAAAAGGGAAYVAREATKKQKKGDPRRINPIVARIVNAGTHHAIRAVMR